MELLTVYIVAFMLLYIVSEQLT